MLHHHHLHEIVAIPLRHRMGERKENRVMGTSLWASRSEQLPKIEFDVAKALCMFEGEIVAIETLLHSVATPSPGLSRERVVNYGLTLSAGTLAALLLERVLKTLYILTEYDEPPHGHDLMKLFQKFDPVFQDAIIQISPKLHYILPLAAQQYNSWRYAMEGPGESGADPAQLLQVAKDLLRVCHERAFIACLEPVAGDIGAWIDRSEDPATIKIPELSVTPYLHLLT